ncbi:MAG: TonB family protein [Planctomycetes bacterium]|nr:TonB family protein [Planctomycetota bacterium]
MSLLHSLYRSNSTVSTLASVAIHIAIGVFVYLGVANFFDFGEDDNSQPPALSVSFSQPASENLPATTITSLEATIVPPSYELPQITESKLEVATEIPSDDESPDITYQPVRPWMPSQLRVRPDVKEVSQAATELAIASTSSTVEVIAKKDEAQCPPPEYPRTSLLKGEQGTVTLLVSVRADGQVSAVSVSESSGHLALDNAALVAVRTWKYIPATTDGQPHAGQILQALVFKTDDKG